MSPEHASIDTTKFLWAVFAIDMSYILLAACQKLRFGSYPAARHHVDRTSITLIVAHILFGSVVIYGGCASWIATNAHLINTIPKWAGTTLAIAACLHSATNVCLLRKIPGTRLLNVPLYVIITVYNVCRALWLLADPDNPREFYLLWCSVSTFVWVRCFILTFLLVTKCKPDDAALYGVIYSVALPYAGMFGIIVPAAALGADARWFTAFAAIIVVAPLMVGIHRLCVEVVGVWPWLESCGACRWVIQSLLDATNPVAYHGQPGGGALVLPAFDGALDVVAISKDSPPAVPASCKL